MAHKKRGQNILRKLIRYNPELGEIYENFCNQMDIEDDEFKKITDPLNLAEIEEAKNERKFFPTIIWD